MIVSSVNYVYNIMYLIMKNISIASPDPKSVRFEKEERHAVQSNY